MRTQAVMMMVTRHVAMDDAISAAPVQRLVMGARAPDGHAWRMPQLRDVAERTKT